MKVSTSQDRLIELFDADPRSDTAIARELGVSKQTVSAWRNGTRSPKKSMLVSISELYHVSIEWLMGFDVDKNGEGPVFIPDTELFKKIILGMTPENYRIVMSIFEQTEQEMKQRGEW